MRRSSRSAFSSAALASRSSGPPSLARSLTRASSSTASATSDRAVSTLCWSSVSETSARSSHASRCRASLTASATCARWSATRSSPAWASCRRASASTTRRLVASCCSRALSTASIAVSSSVGDVGGSGAAGAGRDHVLGGQDAGRDVHREGRPERFEVLGGARHERQAWVQDEPRDPLGAGLEAREHRVRVTELRGFRPVAVAHGSTRLLGFPSARERRS